MLRTIYDMLPRHLVRDEWEVETQQWGDRVKLFRDYYDGNHRSKLTGQMKQMLRITGEQHDQFNENYCSLVVDVFSDRLLVESISGTTDDSTEWASDMLRSNRFDGLQMDIHESTLRDGDTFVMVEFDSFDNSIKLSHEPCWDGDTGMIVVYDRLLKNIEVAVKVWYEGYNDSKRINFYYPDRVEKYLSDETGMGVAPYVDDSTDETGRAVWAPGVVPIVHYRNRARTRTQYGISELASVVPLQDALNRGLMSMVMTAELTAFLVRIAKGFEPPAELSPGMWITIGEGGLTSDQQVDAYTLEPGGIVPFIDQANHLIEQIAIISRTPLPSQMGSSSSSGEALKQRESGLLAKVRKAQVKLGNAHEDLLKLSSMIARAYSPTSVPVDENWRCLWSDAQVRNDKEMIENALAVRDIVGDREVLRLIGEVFDYDIEKQHDILSEKEASDRASMNLLSSNLPPFSQFNV